MTAPDPRLGEIESRLKAANTELDRLTQGNPGKNWRWSIPANPERDSDLILAASIADVHHLLAELREARDALARVEALAEEWRYKGEFGWGAWQEGEGPDPEGYVLDTCAGELRAAVAAAKGDGE